jgi:thymidylate synthase
MELGTYRNVSFATAAGLDDLLARGKVLRVRGDQVHEIRNRLLVLEKPQERCLFLPHRSNNIFASLAETLWVIAGRNDIAWLQKYLPRAAQFSDDGETWRGGYGPRLRDWNGVDQLAAVRELLLGEAATRRAVMTLYDPDRDFVQSKDIPCNNWLHWLIRDGRLHLSVAIRSNDVVWGFSGINSFEWSVLQEMMAFWVGVPVGEATYLASSFHLYDRHCAMAKRVLAAFQDGALATWLALEKEIRQSPDQPIEPGRHLSDPFLDATLRMARLYHGAAAGWTTTRLRDELAALPASDLAAAAYEFFGRKHPEVLASVPHPSIAAFLEAYMRPGPGGLETLSAPSITALLKELHRRKDAAYGDAWKKRGELAGVLANVARKVDRIEQYRSRRVELADESIFDTALDLFVYLTKYRLFLLDQVSGTTGLLPEGAPQPYSDHVSNFDALVDRIYVPLAIERPSSDLEGRIIAEFNQFFEMASATAMVPAMRLERVTALADLALSFVVRLAEDRPDFVLALARAVKS